MGSRKKVTGKKQIGGGKDPPQVLIGLSNRTRS